MLLLLLACQKSPPELKAAFDPIPEGMWTTRPLPCAYEEVGIVSQEGWSSLSARNNAIEVARENGGDAVVDARHVSEMVNLTDAQCREIPECSPYQEGGMVWMTRHTVSGLVVHWVGEDCPFQASSEATPGL